MKNTALWSVIGLCALASAQQGLVFKNSRKNPTIQIEGKKGFVVPESNFELSGNVKIQDFARGLVMTCDKASGDLKEVSVPVPGSSATKKTTEIDNVRLTGGVVAKMSKEDTKSGAKSSSEFRSKSLEYDLVGKDQFKLKLRDSVQMTSDIVGSPSDENSNRKTNSAFTVTASYGEALVSSLKDEKLPVVSALMNGGVLFNGGQTKLVEGKQTIQKLRIKANEATYVRMGASKRPELELRGDLEFLRNQDDDGDAEVTGAQVATLEMNADGVVVKIRFSSEGKGQIKTVIKKKKAGGAV